ncbi:MAG TPA: LytR C-terminal domain-containing protein [Patescibacteria group bacterium]|nr:LytR C-terminal domain-containing protein [Patescibacteria group bacterium]
MVVKRRTTRLHTTHVEASAPSLEESLAKEEKKPVVTQVVEVVEEIPSDEAGVSETVPTPATETQNLTEEHTTPVHENAEQTPVSANASFSTTSDSEDVKRKELVDELFEKKREGEPQVMPEISVHTKRSTNSIILWAIGVIVACIVVGGGLVLITGKVHSFPKIISMPTPTPTPMKITPTPTPQTLLRSALSVQVLNGSGKAGVALKMKSLLESKGYTVVGTGNADNYNYDKTQIVVKAARKDYISLLEKDLGDSYSLSTSAANLKDSASYDTEVIVGKE